MVVMEVMGGGSHVSSIFLPYMCIKCNAKKYFCDTMKNEKMNVGILIFFCLNGKYFLQGFYTL
jgi:hypothetical protein